ncbi:MAG: leucine--tRNA ligase [Parcubacteria group bacterium]|nr:leucine--tRNA ligase [Parcubacteria group bacterium]
MPYDSNDIESKMQAYWDEIDAFRAEEQSKKPKAYILDMFPYPSGDGLHIGHVEGYTATDIVARYKRMAGHEVLHPMGWDSFGLPAENYAMKVNIHPRITTDKNTRNFKGQMKRLGFSYDWSRELDTSSEEYYKWSQWFFLLFYKLGLAYRKEAAVNWCEVCQTVLANDQVVDGKCERSKNPVVQKMMRQWFFKVTEYADRLLEGLDELEWPESLKDMQRNWIGRSEGLIFKAPVKDMDMLLETFSAHFEACYADTFAVIAPDHPLLGKLVAGLPEAGKVIEFAKAVVAKRMVTREEQEPEGIFTGRYLVDPLGNGNLPIWVANFALADYGTGIVKCSAHDLRDFAFAKKYGIKLKAVLLPTDPEQAERVKRFEDCFVDAEQGILTEPAECAGKNARACSEAIIKHCEKKNFARKAVTYRMRDWLISRQRFWGAPIPIVYCDTCGTVPVAEKDLPVRLPKEADFRLAGDGKSPLGRVADFVNTTCPTCGQPAKRETDTMDGFVDNSWYYFRFTDPQNADAFAGKDQLMYWMPVDLYVGGAEHAVGHLIFSRFFTKVLYDNGYVTFQEPFRKLVNQGLILAEDGQKMSKSLGNVINPDDVVKLYGADTLRIYEMFLGPIHEAKPWDTNGILGVRRFLDRVYRFFESDVVRSDAAADPALTASLHRTIKKVTEDIEHLRFNTAISAMMIFTNEVQAKGALPTVEAEILIKILSPFAPHLAEYLWRELGHATSLTKEAWPTYDERLIKSEQVTIAVQINGKTRSTIELSPDADEAQAKAAALSDAAVHKHLAGAQIKKTIYVKGRIVNFIV